MRLLVLDAHTAMPSCLILGRVFSNEKTQMHLIASGVISVAVWVAFSTLLSLTERRHQAEPDMQERFCSVLSAMPFTMVHLTGDYPLVDYSSLSRCIHGAMLVFASGIVALPAAVIAGGFQRELAATRKADREQKRQEYAVRSRAVSKLVSYIRWRSISRQAAS